eukprot:TRINITY_DN1105_c0_g1_i1.p1 TRINITY_DN1105_c0_g1~~TRINITY_DN1105_c0_g1_i1.p1  ORF type:complete len:309 (+),score=67.25 TRINITY_DN1105_c0_g1_i1:3-929(+)
MSSNYHCVQVNTCQKGNPLVKSLRRPLEIGSTTIWDYEVKDKNIHVLFISLRYHSTRKEYLEGRMKRKGVAESGGLKILLFLYDANPEKDDSQVNEDSLHEINATAFYYGFTTLVAWSFEEAAKHMEVLRRRYQRFDALKGRSAVTQKGYSVTSAESILSSLRSVNRPNARKLLSHFKTVKGICSATEAELTSINGVGQVKAQELLAVFQAPLRHTESEASLRMVKQQQVEARLAQNFPPPKPKPASRILSFPSTVIIDHAPKPANKIPEKELTKARLTMLEQMKRNDEAEDGSDDDLPALKIPKTDS